MGKLHQGINGPFSGRVGPVIGTSWMGMAVIRSRPSNRRKGSFTPGELAQQMKFKLMSRFLLDVMSLLNVTFKNLAVRMTGFNKAYSYNVKNAFTGVYPDLKIDHSMVLLSRGDLPNAGSPAACSTSPGELTFTWTDNTGKGKALKTDKVFVAIYSEVPHSWHYELNAVSRAAEKYTMDVDGYNGESVHAYIGFISENDEEVSDSIYIGLTEIK